MEEALDSLLYSLPDLSFAWLGTPALGGSHDHFRGNESKELARDDRRLHLVQSSSCHLLIKVAGKRSTHSLAAVCAQALYQFGKALSFHHHHALKCNGTRREHAIEEQFTKRSQSFFRCFMGKQDSGEFASDRPGSADHNSFEQVFFSGKMTVKRFLRGAGIARDFTHAG